MDDFLAAWRAAVVVRKQYGFGVLCAFATQDGETFTWVVSHDGDFPSAEKAYYESAERAALPVSPADFLADVHTEMVDRADPGLGGQ